MADDTSRLGEIIGKCWKDEAFKKRFLADPKAVLAEHGMPVPDGMNIKVVENNDTTTYITLSPPPPAADELDEGDLAAVAGGASFGSFSASASKFRKIFSMPTSTQGKECVPW